MSGKPFAEKMFAYHAAESEFTDELCDAGFGAFDRIGGDYYDFSIEFYKVEPDARMPEAAQRICHAAGFIKAYVNHKDGWETIYSWKHGDQFNLHRGWRRRYVCDPTAKTTNVIAGEPNPGYYEISYWPEGWKGHEDWLESGYMRVVPDDVEASTLHDDRTAADTSEVAR